MDNGVEHSASRRTGRGRQGTADALEAIALAEGATAQRIFVSDLYGAFSVDTHNAFGDAVALGRGADALAQAVACEEHAEQGERVALVAPARSLASARPAMQSIAKKRLGVVFHAVADRGVADAMALGDLGWGVLFASSIEDSLDLTLIARRAAEDCGTPFVVVHEVSLVKHIELVNDPDASLCEAFVGPPGTRVRRLADPSHPMHAKVGERAFAERVPFALGSAMRELEALTGRKHDTVERTGGNDAPVMLVGLGALGDALEGEVERLRQRGHDVGAVKVTAFRPFPGPRLVRALMRALVVTVLEGLDVPLAQSNPLTREVKAAFADALTWAPEYPGVGRIPRIHSGVVGAGDHQLEAHELVAIVHNMVEGEHGKRLFVLGADQELSLPPVGAVPSESLPGDFAMRGRTKDAATADAAAKLCSAVISSALALKVRTAVRPLAAADGPGFVFDLAAARERPRGVAEPASLRLIVLDDVGWLIHGNPLTRLAREGVIAVPTLERSADALWSSMPPYVKAIAFDRDARVLGWVADSGQDSKSSPWLLAAAFAGIALSAFSTATSAGRAAIDASLVAREVSEHLKTLVREGDATLGARAAAVARQAFEANIEVPRATVLRDEESVRLGRRDTRAAALR
jgi:pyruvate-ferredoxin/flavodoxin oxidoreductase